MGRVTEGQAMQMVILAGGLGTRLRSLTDQMPKSLIPVNGRPFLAHQLELFKRNGMRDIVPCVGHLGDRITGCSGATPGRMEV